MSTTLTTQTIPAEVLVDLCHVADLPIGVINTDQEPGGVMWRQPGIWIDAEDIQQLTVAIAVLAEAIGSGAAEAIGGLVLSTRGGAYGAAASYEARLPGWVIG